MIDGYWLSVRDGDPRAVALYRRHYSSVGRRKHDQIRYGFVGPGEGMVLLTVNCDAVFAWYAGIVANGQQKGVMCGIFRNEGPVLSSLLIREADMLADQRWPTELRHFTYVNRDKVRRKRDPGRCFLRAGWRRCGESKKGLVILERIRGGET